jgi:integrase
MSFYEDFLRYTTVKKGLAPNTIGKLITLIKVLLREAYEKGITTNQIYLNSNFKSISSVSDTVYLNDEEIKELQRLDLSKRLSLERVRDAFIVGCYTGLRFSDLTRIKPKNIDNGMIILTQQKTKFEVVIPMLKEVIAILEKYEFSIPDISNQKYNQHLHELCSKCDLLNEMVTTKAIRGGKVMETTQPKYELISSHTARRSFATNEYKRGELTPSEIMVITGHKTEKSFLKYIRETKKETALRIKEKFILRELKQQAAKENHLKAV